MKRQLRSIFSPVLNIFESGTEAFVYKSSHRTILVVMGCLFSGLAVLVMLYAQGEDPGYLLPAVVFGVVGLVSLLVGLIGNDRAVAKIWGSR